MNRLDVLLPDQCRGISLMRRRAEKGKPGRLGRILAAEFYDLAALADI
jgi:hypothetical protein